MLKARVKVGGLTNLSDARYCAGMGADLLGFPIGTGEGTLSIEGFGEMVGWVVGPELVLEFSHGTDYAILNKIIHLPQVAHIQLQTDQLDILSQFDVQKAIILSIWSDEWRDIKGMVGRLPISYVVVRERATGSPINWGNMRALNTIVPVLIDCTLEQTDFATLLKKPISGLALEGSKEAGLGGSPEGLYKALEALEAD